MLALAGFLVRGGIVLFLLAIVSIPSPLALANVLEPIVTPLYLGRLEPATLTLIVLGAGVLIAWLVLGGWFAAVTEVALIADAAEVAPGEPMPFGVAVSSGPGPRRLAGRAAATHLVALLPAAFAFGIGSIQIYDVVKRELINPTDASPIVPRVLAGAGVPVVTIVVAWLLGEIVGGLAVRRMTLGGNSVLGAVLRAAVDVVRRPIGSLVVPVLTSAVLAIDLAAVLTIVMLMWGQVRTALVHPAGEPIVTGVALVGLGAAWCLALVVTGLIDAWRSVAMTREVARHVEPRRPSVVAGHGSGSGVDAFAGGTFGASGPRRPGDWSADDRGGSL